MKRSTFLRTLAGSVRVGPQLVEAETPEEKEIYDLLDAAVDAQFTHAADPFTVAVFGRRLSC